MRIWIGCLKFEYPAFCRALQFFFDAAPGFSGIATVPRIFLHKGGIGEYRFLMKRIILSVLAALALGGCASSDGGCARPKHRNVAVQAYSMHKITLAQALEKLKGAGVDGIELFPGQKLGGRYPDAKVGPALSAEQTAYLKEILKDAGIKPVSFGVARGGSEKDIEAICKFAKEMGITRVLTEDPVASWEIWDRVGKKYGVAMCVHHHDKGSANQYYDADLVRRYASRYANVKSNPDIGHLSRCGIDPVEYLKTLEGEIGSVHIKDQKEFGDPRDQCVPLGEGKIGMDRVLAELDRQGYDGFLVIEYEADWDDNLPQIKKCVEDLRSR